MNQKYEEKVRQLNNMVKKYMELGLNPLSLATGCAVKVDLLRVLYPALKKINKAIGEKGLKILPREDADIIPSSEDGVEIHRRIYKLGEYTDIEPKELARLRPNRCIVLVQAYQRYTDDPEKFLGLIEPVYSRLASIGLDLYIGKGHTISTPFENDDFILIDFLRVYSNGREIYSLVNNDTIHIVDPSSPPSDYRQVAGAISNALNDVFILGGYRNIKIAPVINAPNEDLMRELWGLVKTYCRKHGFELLDVQQPRRGRMLLGATVLAHSDKEPPTFYKEARPGMKILASRPFGELAPINVYLASILNENIYRGLEELGYELSVIERDKDKVFDLISRPNIGVARVISKYLPDAGEDYNPDENILACTDVTGPGIYVLYELAERLKARININNIPLLYPFYSRFASKNYLMLNSTAGTNGSHIMVAPQNIVEDLIKDLEREGFEPHIIGEIGDIGKVGLRITKEIKNYVVDKRILEKMTIIS